MEQLIGHLPIQRALKKMCESQKIPSVMLFCGPSGVGKRTFAHAFIRKLLNSSKEQHPDIKEYAPENASETYSVAQVDQFISEVSLAPFEAKYRFFLFYDVDRLMNVQANRLLKTLEEMPDHAIAILFAPDSRQLLDTIVSRSITFNFFPLSQADLAQKLSGNALKWAEGSLAKGLNYDKMIELEVISLKALEAYFQNQLDIGNDHLDKIEKLLDKKDESKWNQFQLVLDVMLRWMRDLHFTAQSIATEHLYYPEKAPLFKRLLNQKIAPLEDVKKFQLDAIDGFRKHIRPKTIIQQHLIRMSYV